jgi:GMP synthase-like glutamine amidotransferase
MRLLVLQHEPETGVGAFRSLLDAARVDYEIVMTPSARLPSTDRFDGVLALGGNLAAEDPRLLETRRWIRDSVRGGLPFLGVCLGGQLLASALGGKVTSSPMPEIGLHDVFLRPAARRDPLFAGLRRRFEVFGWHEDRFTLPPGAVLLSTSVGYTYQAFRYGATAYGLQFHPEVRVRDLARWRGVSAYRRLAANAGPDWESLIDELLRATPALDELAQLLLGRWLRLAEDIATRTEPRSLEAA